ncbi:XRE family transcriptional regulator [Amycolatopsis alba DSM 44262]|uniref:XRE family transcriptional regulator n=1 Tax=Amycolatopsis alba DSM 44262 TaxID=1125972 RepID=A0A229R908_AMYAL|nr:XRE family transcriptional regulator [Amycolatopsis alba DSM 44262]
MLTERAGMRGQADIARRANISGSTAASAIRGERLPTWDTTKAIVEACGESVPEWQNDWVTTWEKAERAGQSPPKCPLELLDAAQDPRQAPITAPVPPRVLTLEEPVPADEPHAPDEHEKESRTRQRSRLRPTLRRIGQIATAIAVVVTAGVAIRVMAEQRTQPPAPDCDAIGVAYTGVAAHRVHRQAWLDAYAAHGGRSTLGCPDPRPEQGLVHDWGPGLSQDLELNGTPARLMSIDPDTVIVVSGDFYRGYTEPHWNLAARRLGYPQAPPFPCGDARVVLLTRGEYEPGALVTTPNGRYVWFPRAAWRVYLQRGGPAGPLGRPLNDLGADIDGEIGFEHGGTIVVEAGTARFVPVTGASSVPAQHTDTDLRCH